MSPIRFCFGIFNFQKGGSRNPAMAQQVTTSNADCTCQNLFTVCQKFNMRNAKEEKIPTHSLWFKHLDSERIFVSQRACNGIQAVMTTTKVVIPPANTTASIIHTA